MKILMLTVLFLNVGISRAQSLKFFKNLISPETERVLTLLKDNGYSVEKEIPNDGCTGYKLSKNENTVLYNVCYYDDGDIINLNVINIRLEKAYELLNEAKNDETMEAKISTIEANTAFIFENDSIEMFFVLDHVNNLHYMEISNANRYEGIKELIESSTGFNSETNGIYLMRKILGETNSNGESLEDILSDVDVKSDFSVLNYEQAANYVVELRNSEKFLQLKEMVDNRLLSDEFYVEKIQTSFLKFNEWLLIKSDHIVGLDEGLFKIALENNQFKSVIMFEYIINSLVIK